MKGIFIVSEVLRKEFETIKKHALLEMELSGCDCKDVDEDTRVFAYIIATYKTFHGLE